MRTLALISLAVAAALPAVSQADTPERVSLDACVNAFTRSLSSDGAAPGFYKVVYPAKRFSSVAFSLYAEDFTFDLEQRDVNGRIHARARCLASDRGRVYSLTALSLEAPALAAR